MDFRQRCQISRSRHLSLKIFHVRFSTYAYSNWNFKQLEANKTLPAVRQTLVRIDNAVASFAPNESTTVDWIFVLDMDRQLWKSPHCCCCSVRMANSHWMSTQWKMCPAKSEHRRESVLSAWLCLLRHGTRWMHWNMLRREHFWLVSCLFIFQRVSRSAVAMHSIILRCQYEQIIHFVLCWIIMNNFNFILLYWFFFVCEFLIWKRWKNSIRNRIDNVFGIFYYVLMRDNQGYCARDSSTLNFSSPSAFEAHVSVVFRHCGSCKTYFFVFIFLSISQQPVGRTERSKTIIKTE